MTESEYREGDKLTFQRRTSRVTGVVARHGLTVIVEEFDAVTIAWLKDSGWSVVDVERATPPLPTEPGIYSDVDGDIWLLSLTRVWTILTDEHRARITDDVAPEDGAPFTRLEPVPATAKRVLDRVRTLFGAGALMLAEVDEIVAEFGVKS